MNLKESKTKQPYFIYSSADEPLAFAGLWEEWRGDSVEESKDSVLRTSTIITTQANQKISALHDRMPVILPRGSWEQWLSPQEQQREPLEELLVPADEDVLEYFAVSTEVNNARNQGEQLIKAL